LTVILFVYYIIIISYYTQKLLNVLLYML